MIPELREGQDFSQRYTLLHQITRHHPVELWLALDKETEHRVCVKVFEGMADLSETCQAAIERTRGLIHPGIVRTFEAGVDGDNLFLVTGYVRNAEPFKPGTSSFSESWPLLEQLIAVLEFAHGVNVCHGHLHPGNLLVDRDRRLHVTGFSEPLLITGKNTPYLSSEVLAGREIDPADDIYSLGCITFEILTGRMWKAGETMSANVPVSGEVKQIVLSMLTTSPWDRPADLAEIREILAHHAPGNPDARAIQIQPENFSRRPGGPPATGAGPDDRHAADAAVSNVAAPDATAPAIPSSGVHTADTQVPGVQRRNQVPFSLFAIGLAVLLALALFVFFVLPNLGGVRVATPPVAPAGPQQPSAPDPASAIADTPEPAAPLETAELEYLREKGKSITTQLIRKQVELEDAGVSLWAGDTYTRITELADSGDDLYRQEKYQEAIDTWENALRQLDDLKSSMPSVLEENIAAGEAALQAGDSKEAITAWSIARALSPEDDYIANQLKRAENLEQVLDDMRAGEFHEREGAVKEALSAFRRAAALDPQWQPARDGINRMQARIAQLQFSDAMSEGFSRLAAGKYEAAREAFRKATSIFPDSPEPADGLLQTDLAERMDTIEVHRLAAEGYIDEEDWSGAIREYESIVKLDPTLVFATEGLDQARYRKELDESFTRFLNRPVILQDDKELDTAKELIVKASRIRNPGVRFKQQIRTLSRLISVARIPLPVEITSDDKTEVTIYRVGRLGTFERTRLELIPGQYTIVGKRRGYRDVRYELTLLAGTDRKVIDIRCTERI